jgi:hypothetical protein
MPSPDQLLGAELTDEIPLEPRAVAFVDRHPLREYNNTLYLLE